MKKKIEEMLIGIRSEKRALEDEYPVQFPVTTEWKIACAKLEVLTELLNSIKSR